MAAPDIELPACFYLGREYDLAARTVLDQPVLYDARDLTTHGVVVGMTGSGKTGLCIGLLEEAAIDGIPCIIIDPKGDLANLLLQFPDLKAEDFAAWIDAEDARLKGVSVPEYGAMLADRWRKGLADTYQPVERIRRLQESGEWRVYTPGSEAGLPLSVLQTFAAPRGKISREALNQKIDATATAVLGLTGLSADPVQSREHILIAQLLLHAWSKEQDLDLPQLINQIQVPPLRKIGAFEVDTFFPEKDRLKLAVALNNLLAAPSFSTWIHGESLDLARMLYGPGGKPRHLIFYLAHLEDSQRLFFLTLLLEEVLSWTRKQTGTSNLRAILYFDEVFGYLPPHPANPPTKLPLMTLLKQARAFGVGILLATQNPVDLDYKALSNAGTWFVGKLQTERDKARLIQGLEGVAAERGTLTDRAHLENVISSLGNRVFLLHSVHRPRPILFQSRFALTFLRGPMSPDQISRLMDPIKEAEGDRVEESVAVAIPVCASCHAELQPGWKACPQCGTAVAGAAAQVADDAFKQALPRPPAAGIAADHVAPVLPGDVVQVYVSAGGPRPGTDAVLVYQPRLLGFAEVIFPDRRNQHDHRRAFRLLALPQPSGQAVTWSTAETIGETLAPGPDAPAQWADVPEGLNTARKLKTLEKAFADFIYSTARLALMTNKALELTSEPGEDVVAFQARCREAAHQQAVQALTAERAKYQPRFQALGSSLPDDMPAKTSTGFAASIFSLFGLFRGAGPAGKVLSEMGRGQARKAEALRKLEAEWNARRGAILEKWKQAGDDYSELQLKPRKADVTVTRFALAWAPYWRLKTGVGEELRPAYQVAAPV